MASGKWTIEKKDLWVNEKLKTHCSKGLLYQIKESAVRALRHLCSWTAVED